MLLIFIGALQCRQNENYKGAIHTLEDALDIRLNNLTDQYFLDAYSYIELTMCYVEFYDEKTSMRHLKRELFQLF